VTHLPEPSGDLVSDAIGQKPVVVSGPVEGQDGDRLNERSGHVTDPRDAMPERRGRGDRA
jgi:hypothetical protein